MTSTIIRLPGNRNLLFEIKMLPSSKYTSGDWINRTGHNLVKSHSIQLNESITGQDRIRMVTIFTYSTYHNRNIKKFVVIICIQYRYV